MQTDELALSPFCWVEAGQQGREAVCVHLTARREAAKAAAPRKEAEILAAAENSESDTNDRRTKAHSVAKDEHKKVK